ncbi:MAG: hypothetical protein NXI13_03935 [Proteobacteria bacterium]|nr:hypothetical protein [Pseudomonadota bacterium]
MTRAEGLVMKLGGKFPLTTLALSLVIAAFTSNAATADESLTEISDQYAIVANGWYLEDKCDLLDARSHQELEWQIWRINQWLAKHNGVNFVVAAQNQAKAAADRAQCNNASSKIAKDTLALATAMNEKLTGETYSHPNSYSQYNMRRYTRSALGIEVIMEACNQFGMSGSRWSEVKSDFAAVKAKLTSENPQLMKDANNLIAAQKAEFKPDDCNARAEQRANGALYALSGLKQSLGLGGS